MGSIEERANPKDNETPKESPGAKWIEDKIASMSTNDEENSATANEKIWYFAYGSNMSSAILGERRKVYPTQSIPARVPGWYLNFDVVMPPDLPFAAKEPSFASIGEKPMIESQPDLQGVAHEITRKEMEQIVKTEGKSYKSVEIGANTYDGNTLTTTTLVYPSRDPEKPIVYPSERYLKLLEDGSREYGVEQNYQDWLKTLPRFIVKQSQEQDSVKNV